MKKSQYYICCYIYVLITNICKAQARSRVELETTLVQESIRRWMDQPTQEIEELNMHEGKNQSQEEEEAMRNPEVKRGACCARRCVRYRWLEKFVGNWRR